MPMRGGIVALGACLLGAMCGSAWAQTSDTIQQRIEQLRPPVEAPLPPEEAILTGKEDIVLLRRAKLFTLRADAGYVFTNNAFLSDDLKDDDRIFQPSLTLRAGTRIAERYDVFAEVQAFAARYEDNPVLDFDAFTVRLGGEMPVEDWLLGASYSATPVFENRREFYSILSSQARSSLGSQPAGSRRQSAKARRSFFMRRITRCHSQGDPAGCEPKELRAWLERNENRGW